MVLKEGDKAPDFTLPASDGSTVSLKDLAGKKVVGYFYPKANTPGCTKEACAFRDLTPGFRGAGATVIGVSKDSVKRHDNFKARYELPFTLACDEDGAVCAAYGTWVQKKLYGREYMGIERATFLIDGKGVVRKVWRKVKVAGHVDDVLESL